MQKGILMVLAIVIVSAAVLMLFCGCDKRLTEPDELFRKYEQISQDEALLRMGRDDGHLIVDVRTQEEFAAGHIPGAVCLPNETIEADAPARVPDKDRVLLVYCRTGNRSKQACKKLAGMGYTHLFEFGGIVDWQGETVQGDAQGEAVFSFDNFDGSGLQCSVTADDPTLVRIRSERKYHKPDHEKLDGAGFTEYFILTGVQAGETTLTVTDELSAETVETRYALTVNKSLEIKLERVPDAGGAIAPVPTLVMSVGGDVFYATPADNAAADAFFKKLSTQELALDLREHCGFAAACELPWPLPQSGETGAANAGDLVCDENGRLLLLYADDGGDYTPLAEVHNADLDLLRDALTAGAVHAVMNVEWSE